MKVRLSKRAVLFWLSFLLWALLVCFLSSLSARKLAFVPHPFVGFDKVVHGTLFALGGVFLTAALRDTLSIGWGGIVLISVLSLSLFGVSDEVHQVFSEGRSGLDLGDWVADVLGAASGALSLFLMSRSGSSRNSNPAEFPSKL